MLVGNNLSEEASEFKKNKPLKPPYNYTLNNPHNYLGFRLESPQAFKVEDQGGYSARPPAHHTAGIWPHHPPLTPPPSSTDLTSANSTSGVSQTNPSSHLLHAHHTDLTSVGSTMKGKIL